MQRMKYSNIWCSWISEIQWIKKKGLEQKLLTWSEIYTNRYIKNISYWPLKLNISMYLFIFLNKYALAIFLTSQTCLSSDFGITFAFLSSLSPTFKHTLLAVLLLSQTGLSFSSVILSITGSITSHTWTIMVSPSGRVLCLHCIPNSHSQPTMFQTADINLLQNNLCNIIFLLKFLESILYP